MELNFYKLSQTERKNQKPQIFTEIKGKITEQHLKNEIIKLVNRYIERGYTEEQISQMTFYRYPTKIKKK
ncbi:MAG: hypothetical protein RBT22_09360 [Aliarcobacter sp.]|jgi:hypothetical protein|nr:hypothetical protein [Aliarcobacter sp.]